MFSYLSSAKKTEATLRVYKGKNLMQGIGYTGDRRGCEGNQGTTRDWKLSSHKERLSHIT